MSVDFIIREMVYDDLNEVRALWIETGFKLSYSDSISELKRMLDKNIGLCLVLEEIVGSKKNLIGAVLGGFDGRRGWVHHLAISKSHQKKGHGKKMMMELTKRFLDKKVAKIKLEILDSNKDVIEFYKKIGWDKRKDLFTMSMTLIE